MTSTYPSQWLAFQQAQLALGIKAALEMGQVLAARQSAAAVDILHAQLGPSGANADLGVGPGAGAAEALRELAEVQATLKASLDRQWRAALDTTAQRSRACLDDLRQATSGDEVGGVLAIFMQDLGEQMRADAGRTGGLLSAAAGAHKILLARTLDAMIAAPGTQSTTASTTD